MKVLVYGMQSSGASLFTYFLGQNKNSIVIIDLFNKNIAPKIENKNCDIYLKTVITHKFSFEDHCKSYKPDKKILFVRNPFDNYVSLLNKSYKDENGTIDEKFKLLDYYYKKQIMFDEVIYYEDMIMREEDVKNELSKIDIDFKIDNARSLKDMAKFNHEQLPNYCLNKNVYHQKGKFSSGGIKDYKVDLKYMSKPINYTLKRKIMLMCPSLLALYGGEYA